ncbi:ShlB/FhaC/HecB family hemolysin secretion/activation protein [Pleurocapsa sp. PCC 7319]|uniref:ShlB/FhaC/HecB family hemolysin secretion/activation protein n=1 Tax=Pleurocapsa sp. PCC 7319 TaxID=118161 RepID=UPI000348333F|nr:ShlB/FhaC/HecB family hemolysin secretion/activation protein [Pleurocapsa sp. PCC 7319]
MIVKIAIIRQHVVKILILIGEVAALLAIAFTIEPCSPVIAQPAININNTNASATVKKIRVQGYTIFSEKEIEKIIKPYRGKNLDFNQLRNITEALTDLYVSKGYITSGAFIPEQEIVDGIIDIRVVEGKLEDVGIKGLKQLQENYVRSFISSAQNSLVSNTDSKSESNSDRSSPLNINNIEEELELLKRNSSIANIEAELVKGTQPNLSVLIVEIEETSPFEAKLSFDNYRSPSVGEFQGTLSTGYRNLIGISDRVFAQYNLTEGFDAYSIGYGIPIISNNGTFSFEYRYGDSKIIEDSFEEADIRAEADTVSLQYRQPIIYKSNREVAVGLAFERQNSETFVLDNEPFSFTDGPQQGKSVTSVLKLTGDWVERSSSSVFGVNSELNFGLDAFDATVNNNAPDGLFFSWLGQAQWTQALNQDKDLLLVTRLVTQLSPDSLLPLEQFTLGGVGTVRGYRQNQEVGDNAVVGTVEVYLPLIGDRIGSSKLNLVPFFDGGTVWDNNSDESEALASLGIGLDWQFKEFLSLRADWGVPLINTSDRGNSLQDNGFSFSLQVQPF